MLRSAVFSMLLHYSAVFSRSSYSEGEQIVTDTMALIETGLSPQEAVEQMVATLHALQEV